MVMAMNEWVNEKFVFVYAVRRWNRVPWTDRKDRGKKQTNLHDFFLSPQQKQATSAKEKSSRLKPRLIFSHPVQYMDGPEYQ